MCITPKDTHGSGDEKVRLVKEGVSRMLSPQYVEGPAFPAARSPLLGQAEI